MRGIRVVQVKIRDIEGIDRNSLVGAPVIVPHFTDVFVEEAEIPIFLLVTET